MIPDSILADPTATLVALDFDGTLAPIVPRPDEAVAHPRAAGALAALAAAGCRVAIVTGRPVTDVLRLAPGFADVPGLLIYGHYGLERWADGEVSAPEPHPGVAPAREALRHLVQSGPPGADVEDKVRSVALHTRNTADPGGTLERLRPSVGSIAEKHGLEVVAGRNVLELRPAGIDKGGALRELVAVTGAGAVLFAGDDLGDLPAVAAVRSLAIPGLVVCSDSPETPADLRDAADVIVDGPDGLVSWLHMVAEQMARS